MWASDLLQHILAYCSLKQFPDIHLNSNHLPIYREHNWEIVFIEKIKVWNSEVPVTKLTEADILVMIKDIVQVDKLKIFEETLELDCSYLYKNWDRYRVNCYKDSQGYSIAMRIIPRDIPSMDSLWLWEKMKEICGKSKGLILMTWPTWSWKSTNLAAMIDYINITQKRHIITIEDPIEFSFKSDKSLINQREIGNHTKWFSQAMKSCLREDPDVIMVWEMRDPETIQTALSLAETWHLVFSTLHTNDSVQTVDRIVDIFPSEKQKQIRMQLAMSLVAVVSQRLLPRSDNKGRVPAREVLIANDAVKNLIISWKTHQLYSVLEVWQKYWMILMDKYLMALYEKELISREVLLSYVRDREVVEMLLE